MDQMLETVADDTAVAIMGRAKAHSLPVGSPCRNCATTLAGAWCHACGQRAEAHDRSIRHLAIEAVEGLTHADGRIWTTLGRLIVRPARLTRDYLDGHRAPQIPPFRMFLVVLLAVFFAGSWNFQAHPVNVKFNPQKSFITRDAADRAAFGDAAEAMRAKGGSAGWLLERVETATKDPEAMLTAMEHWSHQFAILMLPIAAVLLSALFAFRRGVRVFDHLIFSMHSLSFQGLLLTTAFLVGLAVGDWAWLLLLIAPIHLYAHMRGVYATGPVGTLARMLLLWAGSLAGFVILMVGLMFAGLASLH